MERIGRWVISATLLVAAAALAGCGSLSRNIAEDGSTAAQLRWPAPGDTDPLHRGGTWPAAGAVRRIHAGMTKHQVMALVGSPQFGEGWGVHEWDYLFHLRDVTTGQAQACQYKVLFDRHMVARSFYWKPEGCARLIEPIARVTVTPATADAPSPSPAHATVPASAFDMLFAFDASGMTDVQPAGLVRLHRSLEGLKRQVEAGATLVVNGYAGRIGTSAYNGPLSLRRANAVRDYLVGHGIPAEAIETRGHGARAPVVACGDVARSALIACLAPNRRVQILVRPAPDSRSAADATAGIRVTHRPGPAR